MLNASNFELKKWAIPVKKHGDLDYFERKKNQKTINFSQNLTFCEKGMNLTIGRWELFASIELYGRPGKIWPKNSDWFLFQNDWFFLGVIWAYNSLWKKLVRAKTNQIENILFRDLQTKTDRSKDQEKISDRTRTKQILKISDQFGPVGSRTRWSVYPWSYWSNCCHVQYRQCIIAVCMEWLNYHVKWFYLVTLTELWLGCPRMTPCDHFSYVEFIIDHTAPFGQIETYNFSRISFKVMNYCWV